MNEVILQMKNITKIYPNGFKANDKIDFSVNKGEIHALMGENGAGKSTLMKILFGLEDHQEGVVYVRGEETNITSPSEAIDNGIGMVHQHFMLVPSFSVTENLMLGIEPSKYGFVDREKMALKSSEISQKYNLDIDINATVSDLSVGKKQKVEILKVLLRGAEILILDEPTAVLTPQETKELFEQLILLKESGHTIIFISHKLDEIKEITDRITILKNGRMQKVVNTNEVTKEEISRLMVGRDVMLQVEKVPAEPKEVCLRLNEVTYESEGKQVLNKISLALKAGEILGVAGVEDNGQSELAEVITGMKQYSVGQIEILGSDIKLLSVRDIRELGVAHIHEDRMVYGVSEHSTTEENMISNHYYKKEYNHFGLMKSKLLSEESNEKIKEYQVKVKSVHEKITSLSGGNIQKIVVAREFTQEPKLIIANQPSRGIDVGTIEFIYQKLIEFRDSGSGVLLISADLNEVLGLSDKLIVMYKGEVVAYYESTENIDIGILGEYMLGLRKQSQSELEKLYEA